MITGVAAPSWVASAAGKPVFTFMDEIIALQK
jgi:hypothetical protein